MTAPLRCFAITAPGLEPLTAAELRALGIAAREAEGGVEWTGDADSLYRANLWSRTASRVVVRVAEFQARAFFELEKQARRVPWEQFVAAGAPVRFRVTARKSRLYHTDAIAQRLADAVAHRLGARPALSPATVSDEEDSAGEGAQLFVVRVVHDRFTVSADSSGALLHRRGYRQAVAKAPLRETLAAALLMASEWNGQGPLVDPLCGSGTIPIEGAMMARRIAPGLARSFAFEHWPSFDGARWARLVAEARASIRPSAGVTIVGSDRDAGAITAARANAERAGVAGDLSLEVRPLSALEPPASAAGTAGAGWLVANPPYGVRVGEADRVRDLYARLGQLLRQRCAGWTVALLSPGPALERQLRLPLEERVRTRNGGLPVRMVVGRVRGESVQR